MKRRSSIFFLCILCTAMLLSGCTKATSLTDAERDAIAEYVAYLLLKYDKDYESRLVEKVTVPDNPSMVEEEFTVIGEQEDKSQTGTSADGTSTDGSSPTDNTPSDGSQGGAQEGENGEKPTEKENVELAEIFAAEGIQISFDGYQEYSSYPEEEGFFSLVAPKGKKLAVMKFTVQNSSKKERAFHQADSDIRYRLDLDAENFIQPDMTLLVNDLQYMDTVLKPKEKMEAVVVFTVDKKVALLGTNLLIYTETKTAIEELK